MGFASRQLKGREIGGVSNTTTPAAPLVMRHFRPTYPSGAILCGLRFGIQSAGKFEGLMWLRMARRNMVCMANKPLQPGLVTWNWKVGGVKISFKNVGMDLTIKI